MMKNKRSKIQILTLQNEALRIRLEGLQSENEFYKSQQTKLFNLASDQFATELSMLKKLVELEAELSKAKSAIGKR